MSYQGKKHIRDKPRASSTPGNWLLAEESSLAGLEEGRKRWRSVTSFARKDASPAANQLLSGLPSIMGEKKTHLNSSRVQSESLRKMRDGSGGRQRSRGKGKVEGQEVKMCSKQCTLQLKFSLIYFFLTQSLEPA